MSYQIEFSNKDLHFMGLCVCILPCLLFAAGFLTASLTQGTTQTQAAHETAGAAIQAEPSPTEQGSTEKIMDAEAAISSPQLAAPAEQAPQALPAAPESVTTSQQYSVQAAAFHSAANAISYAAQLQSKGYPAEVAILSGTKASPIYKVIYGSFGRDVAAKAAHSFTRQEKMPAFVVARS